MRSVVNDTQQKQLEPLDKSRPSGASGEWMTLAIPYSSKNLLRLYLEFFFGLCLHLLRGCLEPDKSLFFGRSISGLVEFCSSFLFGRYLLANMNVHLIVDVDIHPNVRGKSKRHVLMTGSGGYPMLVSQSFGLGTKVMFS